MQDSSRDSIRHYIDGVADEFEAAWKGPTAPRIREFFDKAPEHARNMLLEELILLDLEYRRKRGDTLGLDAYLQEFPQLAAAEEALKRLTDAINRLCHGPELDPTELPAAPPADRNKPPKYVGPYRILEPLGEGGMGEVYKAEQRTPVQRIVAIKLMKGGFDSAEVIARFQSERQALARMDHPSIAKVLDAGTDELGRPYFVMEYVPGAPVTKFADDNKLTVRQRLELFIPICDAIAHAHTKSLIHRDIKAGNVMAYMADGKAQVKVIDFGVAKAMTGDRLSDRTYNTQHGQAIGTYDTMSPEQVAGSPDIDTRTDVYSLGVVLYELLAGVNPFDRRTFATATHDEIRRLIREVEPPRPSTRLLSIGSSGDKIAANRGAEVRTLAGQLRKELEWIPMKAMRKERDRRYASPLELAEDITNYLENRPLRAGPESVMYRLRKTLRRNRAAAITTTLVTLLIASGIGVYIHTIRAARNNLEAEQSKTLAALDEARKQGDEAKKQAAIAEAVNRFQREMLAAADPDRLLGDKVTVLQATQEAIKKLDDLHGPLKDQPLVAAAVWDTIGETLRALQQYERAEKSSRRALEIRQEMLPPGHRDIVVSLDHLGSVLMDENKLNDAKPLFDTAIAQLRSSGPAADQEQLASTLSNLGVLLHMQNKLVEAERPCREALEIRRRKAPPDGDVHVAESLNNLANLLRDWNEDKLPEAESLLKEVLKICERSKGTRYLDIATAKNNLAVVLLGENKPAEAKPLYRDVLAMRSTALPPGHPDIAASILGLARVIQVQKNRSDVAEKVISDALKDWREKFKDFNGADPRLANLLVQIGIYRLEGPRDANYKKQLEDGIPLLKEAVQIFEKSQRPDDLLRTAMARTVYGRTLVALQKYGEAESCLRTALETREKNLGTEAVFTRFTATALAEVLDHTGRPEEAGKIRQKYGLPAPETKPGG